MPHITDPQQELFTRIKLDTEALKYAVYDGFLPPPDTPYPFVYLGDNQQTDRDTKDAVIGRVHQIIHVWHNNPKQRGKVSDMMLGIKTICRNIRRTAHHSWEARNISSRIFPDNTTKTPLLHGVVEVDFYFTQL
jgi:hypothetical protein